jgi:predicted tellurium resistance membrane protein TerC
MVSSSLEADAELSAPTNTHRATTEGNSRIAATDSAMKELATDKSPLARPDCSVLEGSKMHADTGSSSPLLLVVLCTVLIVDAAFDFGSYSINAANDFFPVMLVGGTFGTAALGCLVSCLKRRRLVVP